MSAPTPAARSTVTPDDVRPADATVAAGLIEPAQYEAPMPTARTRRLRTNLPVQAYRFAAVSLRMTRMVLRSHG
jgi:hypothetical protein